VGNNIPGKDQPGAVAIRIALSENFPAARVHPRNKSISAVIDAADALFVVRVAILPAAQLASAAA